VVRDIVADIVVVVVSGVVRSTVTVLSRWVFVLWAWRRLLVPIQIIIWLWASGEACLWRSQHHAPSQCV
jgi:hypothetical protein